MGEYLAGLVFVAVFGLVLRLIERRFASRPPADLFTRKRLVDVAHWIVGAPLGRIAADYAFIAAIALVFPALILQILALGHVGQPFVAPFTRLPLGVQAPLAFLIADLCGYWSHRIQHVTPLWRFHAIHHSARELDWLASARNHPIGEVLGRMLSVAPLILLGVDPRILGAIIPFVGLWAIFVHANVRWTFGPLRYLITTPHFHRWHHSRAPEARDKNFSGLLPIWDILFGTFYLPAQEPSDFGVDDHEAIPDGFVAQMIHPLRRQPRRSAISTAARTSGLESFGSAASAESLRATCSSTAPS